MPIIDGKKLAEEIKAELKTEVLGLNKKIRLAVIKVGKNPVTEKFLEQKKKFGEAVGIDVRIYDLQETISTNQLREKLAEIVHIKENTGVIIQLPLPKQINTQYILDGIIPEKDPDMLSSKSVGLFSSGRSKILPPVVGAIKYIFDKNNVDAKGKNVTVLGAGRLVGKPVAVWLMNQGAAVTIIDENTADPTVHTIDADIIISGVGEPNLITADMVKDNAVVIDCGTSEAGGKIVGDIDPRVADKASLFSPVPGGIGPLTVSMLFKNLAELAKIK
ncbi:MAG: Bifunctional protein FolD [Candidatus Giovannonibacteria bacterium GW2011_GWC2_44_9]|uniref:Bifunctional protein FolD n=2 Tax=Candidatus Giovannoniibacteriota TaxID=1752738 RepID=A0A0G1ICW1_9BACT|nr:MAG: Bifunctional protein FolD [Candidatus Giovannonibacteria bacterium GW2011_GWB1_44_23]KKT83274.1 MAG: Bifunctional protein FolD [Candidatus Giovannonibacteria bacterium GW2011_GWC2_44_9]